MDNEIGSDERMNIQVLYVSKTGNTEKIAKEIYRALPSCSKDIKELESAMGSYLADLYFIGFWVNRGTANVEVLDFLSGLSGKKIAFFATCGMGNSPEYYRAIEQNVLAFLPDGNDYLGSFFCQGKMPMRVRQKYEQMMTDSNQSQMERMIQNFDNALLHPSRQDLENASAFARRIFSSVQQTFQEAES